MATNQRQTTPLPPRRSGRFRRAKCTALMLLSLIVLVGLAVLIIWLVIHPRRPVFTVDDAYKLTKDPSATPFGLHLRKHISTKDHLDATFDLSLRAHNPNSRFSVYYDDIQVTVEYDHQDLASSTAEPFLQRHKNKTLHVLLQARNVTLRSKNLRNRSPSGAVQLEVRLRAKVRFKVGIWKSRHRTLQVYCCSMTGLFTRGWRIGTNDCEV